MKKCYFCGVVLSENNQAVEHVIPNSFGGRLKSKDILCKECNSILGTTVDAKLYSDFKFFDILMNIKKDRETKNNFVKANINDTEIKLSKGLRYHSAPNISVETEGSGIKIKGVMIASADNKEAQDILYKNFFNKIKKHGFNGSIDDMKNSMVERIVPSDKWIELDRIFNLDAIVLGYLKVAIGFCSYHGKLDLIDEKILDTFRKAAKDKNSSEDINLILDNTSFIEQKYFYDGRLCNRLSLVGDKDNHKLYAVVGICDIFHFAIVLNDNYSSDNFEEKYIYDVINQKEIDFNMPSYNDIASCRKNNKSLFDVVKENSENNIKYIMSFFCVFDLCFFTDLALKYILHAVLSYDEKMDSASFEKKFIDDFCALRVSNEQLRFLSDEEFGKLAKMSYEFYSSNFDYFLVCLRKVYEGFKVQNSSFHNFLIDDNLFDEEIVSFVKRTIKNSKKDKLDELLKKIKS
ncbi:MULTISPECIES: HNH endonuclease [Campylobacter]|uniref:HNH endonuclease n=1 Tax=Campylobacter magnus TaxID=3026462 RepID=A0ABT8T7C6_9BACT|nr:MULTISPECIES: HNH endonuclease [Campylobacter]MDO2409547.1 HNH endonuclease [Campylobacter magnus]MDY2764178.1 HNH endonuclease [Campylobacter sp.]